VYRPYPVYKGLSNQLFNTALHLSDIFITVKVCPQSESCKAVNTQKSERADKDNMIGG